MSKASMIMTTLVKGSKKGVSAEDLGKLQDFILKVKKGEITPFKEKTERARKNLKKAGLIK
jgi:sporulation protein YlmC with PRC-barrel domain